MSNQPVRWEPQELIGILRFIKNHFNAWHKNKLDACNMAIQATSSSRDAKSVYSKVHNLLKPVRELLKTGKKSTNCTIVWENRTIHGLLREIIEQEKNYVQNQETNSHVSDGDVEMMIIDDVDDEVTTEETSMLFSTELVNSLYEKKIQEIEQNKSKLIETTATTNNAFKNSNIPSPYSIDIIDRSYFEKNRQASELRSELIKTIEIANKIYEKLKNFQ
ncbi:hypothetical protein C1645_806215 [Glomus cerebriforme]|uniref:Myb/SANT-like domain-containing protein n=1 Tax=Glomus cerebriforme TaxID=658196 RepID=A0A397T396_9GLOM|nr:hypothetical protein C1645_806215 [Glomus cerebriforme]